MAQPQNHIMQDIPGWGVDADPKDRPAYPMKQPDNDNVGLRGMTWQRPTQQEKTVEILHSNERPSLSAVFGTTVPPRGLSGIIRRFAFRYSEGSWGHWIPLLMADRINVIEGIFSDLAHGRIPNIFGEMGIRAEMRYNPLGLARKLLIVGLILVTLSLLPLLVDM